MALLGGSAAGGRITGRAGASVMLYDPTRRQRLRVSTGARTVVPGTSITAAW
ncbi:hypothetical protein HMPREF1861_01791 [Corynebacterium kroppenstedtii]|nr:hypothetical protein HMPREF1861_01791 [Corynebacterium kroppenstedtii]